MTIIGVSPFSGESLAVNFSDSCITGTERYEPAEALAEPVYVSPGMIDLQVNGYRGIDYSMDCLELEHITSMVEFLAAAGITQHLPTIITSSRERILQNLAMVRVARERDEVVRLAIPGVHVEGPFISGLAGTRGVHDAAYVRAPDIAEFRQWQEASGNTISIVTLAPELPGAMKFIEQAAASGVTVAIGHTAASPQLIRDAVSAGARLSTHLGNGCAPLLPRLQNFLWAQLASDSLWASIIADGDHLPAEVLQTFARSKGLNRLILVSDVAPLGGFDRGLYKWGNIDVEVFEDGHLGLPGSETLAGAAHLLDQNVVHFARTTGTTIGDTLRLCTQNPAQLLGIDHPSPSPAPGEPANLVVFRQPAGTGRLQIVRTIIGGRTVFET